jgi:hydrogenase expression/formation protein HypC
MCLAVPGKIIEINGDEATVDYDVEKRKALLLEKSFKVGDYVIVQGKTVVQKIEKKEAIDALRLYRQSVG